MNNKLNQISNNNSLFDQSTSMNRQNNPAKVVQGELVDPRQSVASDQAFGRLSQSLQNDSLFSRLLAPREQRQIADKLRGIGRQAAVEQAIEIVTSETNKRCEQARLEGQAQRDQLRLQQNRFLTELSLEQQATVSNAVQKMLVDERANQRSLAASQMLPEDREMLSQLFKIRTADQIAALAQTHGVQYSSRATPPESQSTDDCDEQP
jgi:hypothetical protein